MLKENYAPALDAGACRLINNVVRNAWKMGQLIDDLLSLSGTARKGLSKTDIPINEIIANICLVLKNAREDRNIEFNIDHLSPAYADGVNIKMVWTNLISNTGKYSGLKQKAISKIGSEHESDKIIYHIIDNGTGFDLRYADTRFGVFQHLQSDEEFEGTGVGPALVHRIIRKYAARE